MTETITRRDLRESASRKPWSKRKKLGILGGIPLALVALPAAAAVLFAALAGIQGSGSSAEFTAKFVGSATMDTSGMVVQPSGGASIANDKLVLPAVKMFPGESFTVEAQVQSGASDQKGYISSIELPGLGSGYTATLVNGCGQNVEYAKSVTIRIQAPAASGSGSSWTLSPEAGIRVTPGDAAPAGLSCAVYTAP